MNKLEPSFIVLTQFLKKLNINLQCSISTPGNLSKRNGTYVHIKTYKLIFIAALFIILENWNQPKSPSPGEWVTKCGISRTMAYYSGIKMES